MKLLRILIIIAYTIDGSAQTITYTYDDLNRLTQAVYTNGTTITYTYDKLGNRLGLTVVPGNNCTTNLSVTGSVTTGQYLSDGDLVSANATVPNGAVVDFISNTGIVLNGGFTTVLGADFDAFIQPCPSNANPPNGDSLRPGGKGKKEEETQAKH